MKPLWSVVKDESHWLEVVENSEIEEKAVSYTDAESQEYGTAAVVKWDGCVHLRYAGYYIHICSLNVVIDRLIELPDMARERRFEVS